MRRNQADLLIVSGLVLLTAAVSILSGGHSNGLHAALSLPFVLFLPGYAFSAALLPDGRTGLAERLALSIGLSIAIAALGGLLLNVLPAGLTAGSWRLLLLGVTLTAAAFAFLRRNARPRFRTGPARDADLDARSCAADERGAPDRTRARPGCDRSGPDRPEHGGRCPVHSVLGRARRGAASSPVIQIGLHNFEA